MLKLLDIVGPWACAAFIFGVPIALAWWLSDGFTNFEESSPGTRIRPGVNPITHMPGLVVVSRYSGLPVAFIG